MRRPIQRVSLAVFAVTLLLRPFLTTLRAADLPSAEADYLIDVWQSDDGLPQNSVITMAQTTDGYLWVSTFGGLARFNGRRFDVFDGDHVPELFGETFGTLRADRSGNLWLRGQGNRLLVCQNGHFRKLGEAEGLPPDGATDLDVGPDGTVWIGDSKGRVLKYEHGHFVVVKETPPTPDWGPIYSLQIDSAGGIWTWSIRHCARLANGEWSLVGTNALESIGTVRALRDGSVVVATGAPHDRLIRYSGGVLSEMGPIPGGFHGYFLAEDPTGELWTAKDPGVMRREPDGRWSEVARAAKFPPDTVRSELLDREGNRWFGTDGGGLVRLKRRAVQAFGETEGMSKKIALSLAGNATNGAWVAVLHGGLNRFDGSRFSQVLVPRWLESDSLAWCVRPAKDGGVWVGTYSDGLLHLDSEGGHFERFDSEANPEMPRGPVTSLFETGGGDLWFGGEHGACRYSHGKFRTWTGARGLTDDQVTCVEEEGSGALWIGTAYGVNRLEPNADIAKFTTVDGLAGNSVRAIFRDSEGNIWIGGYGLTRFKNGKFSPIDATNGPSLGAIKSILQDDAGCLWLGTAHGILRSSLRQLNEFCDRGNGQLEFTAISKADGLPSNECSGYEPAAWKSDDGRLWFATLNGIALIDPKNLVENKQPPPVVIEAVLADGKLLTLPEDQRPLRIPAGTVRLEFHSAALSFTAPEKNRFRCRLERYDSDWNHAGAAETASYTRLPPGDYRFHVRACNNDGVWNESGATLAVTVLPFFWQTGWFHALIFAVAAALLYWAVRTRLAQVERRRLAQESFARQLIETQETERQRIARELHDGVGQSLLLVKNRLTLGLKQADSGSPIVTHLEQASSEVSQAIEEVRATARLLRPVELDRLGLAKALESMLERITANTDTRISSELDDLGELNNREMEIQLYRIAQEAINNVLKHSKAPEVIVELKREATGLRLTVQDDGIGFDSVASAEKRGFGLSGMTERARLIGGELSVKSALGKGCRLTVTVPLAKPNR